MVDSNAVNAPPIKPPRKWLDDRELSDYVQQQSFFSFQLWKRSGGGTDNFTDILLRLDIIEAAIILINAAIDAINAEIIAIKARLDALEALVFIQVTATANHATTRNEVITCTNTSSITISLNASPDALEEVHCVRAGSSVIVSGNGKLIMGVSGGSNGVSTFTLNVKGQGVQIVFNSDTDKWHIQ